MHDSPYTLDERAARAAGAVVRGAELRLPCPVHNSSPETLAIRQGDRAPVWHCHAGCNPVHVREALLAAGILLRERSPSPGPPPRPADDRSPPRWIARVWNRAAPIAGTLADDYLRARGLAPPWTAASSPWPKASKPRSPTRRSPVVTALGGICTCWTPLLDTAQHDPLKYEPAVPQAIPEDSGSETGEEVHGWSVIETGQSDGAKWRS